MAPTSKINKNPPAQMKGGDTSIFYHPDGFDTSGEKLMGRQAAGEGFLKGWMTHGCANPVSLWSKTQRQGDHGAQTLLDMGWLGQTERSGPDNVEPLRRTGNLFLPGPGLAEEAWLRHWHGDNAWSLCGVTHTTASHRALDAIAGCLQAPTQPWDALICTSKAVLSTVEALFEREADWIKHRFGGTRLPRPQLPVIPLGVHAEYFTRNDALRAKWRSDLGIEPETICVLWMGRLSFHAKAHPAPLLRALEAAATQSQKSVCLVFAGWFANDPQKNVFLEGAKRLAPSIQVRFVDARPKDARQAVWSIGDIFTLPSDNIQETFGLAPVEGMAAGLPVVATDWNGFRDSIQHGKHGFLIPTFQPAAGTGASLAYAHEADILSYDHYIGGTAQHAGFDHDAAVTAFKTLFEDDALRARMGAAGQDHVRSNLDWSHVIARYKELFRELAGIRQSLGKDNKGMWQSQRPTRQDPFALFQCYPTHPVTPQTWIEAAGSGQILIQEYQSAGNVVWAGSMSSLPQLAAVHQKIAETGKVRLEAILSLIAPLERERASNGIAWLAKHGLVKLSWET
jgi:alpha-maltose-1-phosphate synthase